MFFDGSEPDYSELTPGYDAEIGCREGKWTLDMQGDTMADYRRKIRLAKNCRKFASHNE